MKTILHVRNLKKYFSLQGFFKRTSEAPIKALDGVDLEVKQGETLGLVGESGCGKSTLAQTLLRLYEPSSGEIFFRGENFCELKGQRLRETRRHFQMIFQDPSSSLDPRMTVGESLLQPLEIHGLYANKEQRREKVLSLLEKVGLQRSDFDRFPHEFSGGQKQRICIARTIGLEPDLIIADEPVSSLDLSTQTQILKLLKDLQNQLGLTYIFISHDLRIIEKFCDRIAVMYLGRIIEEAPKHLLFTSPKHPYTQALLKAILPIGQGPQKIQASLTGEVPSPLDPPLGCHFHPRCPWAREQCQTQSPELRTLHPGHRVACWLSEP